jgi:hypothetical protein
MHHRFNSAISHMSEHIERERTCYKSTCPTVTYIRVTSAFVSTLVCSHLWATWFVYNTWNPGHQNLSNFQQTTNVPNTKPSQSASKMPWTQHVENSTQMDLRHMQWHVPNQNVAGNPCQRVWLVYHAFLETITVIGCNDFGPRWCIIAHALCIRTCKKCFSEIPCSWVLFF